MTTDQAKGSLSAFEFQPPAVPRLAGINNPGRGFQGDVPAEGTPCAQGCGRPFYIMCKNVVAGGFQPTCRVCFVRIAQGRMVAHQAPALEGVAA